jgi:hypothetical protein
LRQQAERWPRHVQSEIHAAPRIAHTEPRPFNSTDKWFTVYRGLTAAECFREIEENEIFWPST